MPFMSTVLTDEEIIKTMNDPKQGKLRLSANSEAVILLREKFESGSIDPAHTPAQVRNSESVFQRYPLATFRTCYKKLKKEYYPETDEDKIESRHTPTSFGIEKSPKRVKLSQTTQFVHKANDDGSDLLSSRTTFAQIAFLSDPWSNPGTATQMITLTIKLPSGTKSFYSRIVDDGDYVELKVKWASPVLDVDVLHRKWLQPKSGDIINFQCFMERYHLKILAIESALRKFHEHSTSSIYSYARFHLPFSVQPEPKKHNLSFGDDSTLIHQIYMTAFTDKYDFKEDTLLFENV